MTKQFFIQNWALVAAIAAGGLAAFVALAAGVRHSAYGQLRRVRGNLKRAMRAHRTASNRTRKCEKRLRRLGANVASTKPRTVTEAKEAHEDALALEKIARDKVMIAMNHVRRVITEEFPPVAQERLRRKCLPADPEDKRPFSF
jgi:hypothetical protein